MFDALFEIRERIRYAQTVTERDWWIQLEEVFMETEQTVRELEKRVDFLEEELSKACREVEEKQLHKWGLDAA